MTTPELITLIIVALLTSAFIGTAIVQGFRVRRFTKGLQQRGWEKLYAETIRFFDLRLNAHLRTLRPTVLRSLWATRFIGQKGEWVAGLYQSQSGKTPVCTIL